QFAAIATAAPFLKVDVSPVNMRDAGEIERAVAAFARSPNGGLIITAASAANVFRDVIIKLAAQHKLPTGFYERSFVAARGLVSYGTNFVDQHRVQQAMSTASSRARSRPIFLCRRRPNTSWSSISRLPSRLASLCQQRCSPPPTNSSNS